MSQRAPSVTVPRRGAIAAILAVLALVAALVAVRLVSGGPARGTAGGAVVPTTPARAPSAAAVARAVATVPPSTLAAVGAGTASRLRPLSAPALRSGGKPLVLYVGAEYCPYCAAQRWALVNALSRFGRFEHLRLTRSALDDVFPGTPTFSFYGSTYHSRYLTFQGVEVESNQRDGSAYRPLQALTSRQQRVFDTYNRPPYVPSQSAGAIPFLDLGGRYLLVGAQYLPDTLQGRTWQEIAAALRRPESSEARAVIGAANVLTAGLCHLSGNRPAAACSLPVVRRLAG